MEFNFQQGWNSPYHNDTHREFQRRVREHMIEIKKLGEPYEISGRTIKKHVWPKFAKNGGLALQTGFSKYLSGVKIYGFNATDLDHFHESIFNQELGRAAIPGFFDGICAGCSIGLVTIEN